jgi:hypothetical protein
MAVEGGLKGRSSSLCYSLGLKGAPHDQFLHLQSIAYQRVTLGNLSFLCGAEGEGRGRGAYTTNDDTPHQLTGDRGQEGLGSNPSRY